MKKKDTKKEKNKSAKDNKKSSAQKNNPSMKKTNSTSKPTKETSTKKNDKDKNKKTTKEKDTEKKKKTTPKKSINDTKKTTSKPRNKKKYEDEEEDLLETEELLDEEESIEDEDEEISDVDELDISNIEPVITDDDVLLEDEDEEEYVPKTRGRKKQVQPEIHHQQTMEEIIRNRPLQIDPTQKTYVIKKEEEPKPYINTKTESKERYSDKELMEFKEIILQKLKETKENYEQLRRYFTNEDNNGIDDTSPTFKMIEDGSEVMTKEEIEQQLARLEKYMIDLQNALLRIENKTYGICTVTGKLIPKERLKSVPHATKSIEAKINRD